MADPPVRRLNDRIRKLCTLAASATEEKFVEILWDLQAAMHEHATQTCEMATRQGTRRRNHTLRETAEGFTIQ